MPIIHKLSKEEAQKIAAGEVVERPASVIKELVENSIDAGATTITVAIRQGGKMLMSCTDNGCGMDTVDAYACIEPHATSKIKGVEDLYTLDTFGFRGEALASLAAVSALRITTKQKESAAGIQLLIQNNTVTQEKIVARETGTTIEVHNLFSTVPARLKFLKKDETEQRHIIHLFDALFLSHPAIHAKLMIDDGMHCNYPATKTLHERAQQIIASKTDASLLPVHYTKNGILVEGAISTHQAHRFDKNGLFIFVNRRWVKNIGLTRAVMRAYTALPDGKFPITSLHITIDPALIDVNIHPRKEEVAFTHSAPIEQAITAALTATLENALSTHIQMPPYVKKKTPLNLWQTALQQPIPPLHAAQSTVIPPAQPFNTAKQASAKPTPIEYQQPLIPASANEETDTMILGQLDATYILATTPHGLTIIDQHAAHERILYEQFVSRFGTIDTVQLLFPELVQLSLDDYALIMAYQELLAQHGIVAEPFGTDTIRVTALPIFAKHISAQQLLTELGATLHEMPLKADAHLFLPMRFAHKWHARRQ